MATTNRQHASEELISKAEGFLSRYYREEILELANTQSGRNTALTVDWNTLFQYDPDLADDLLNNPKQVREALDIALQDFDAPVDLPSSASVRVINLNPEELHDVGEYRSQHIGQYVGIEAQVQQVTETNPIAEEAIFVCQRCGAETAVPQSDGGELQGPYQCESCERQGPFKLDPDRTGWGDIQKVKVQKPPSKSGADGTGASLEAVLRDEDLVGDLTPGDRVNLYGNLDIDVSDNGTDYVLNSNGYQQEDQDFDDLDIGEYKDSIEEIRDGERGSLPDVFVESLAPQIYGHEQIKLSVVLQFFAPERTYLENGTSQRGSIHLLILGDPGCGKSDILEHAKQIAPRSIMSSGENSSGVGFTASVTPDDFGTGKWTLQGGAMVLADQGLACIDELDKAEEEDRQKLHKPMEEQKVVISKADFSGVELNARSSVLAAGNPKYGRFDPHENTADQIELSPTLMSRFDLMFMIRDEPDEEHDRELARHQVRTRQAGKRGEGSAQADAPVDVDEFRAYVAYARSKVSPSIEEDSEVERLLEDFYVELRQLNDGSDTSAVPVTVRKLAALQRLAEASARMRLSETVEVEDAKRAMALVRKAMADVGKDSQTGEFDADIVNTGSSRTQQERKKTILSIVEEKGKEMATVPMEEIRLSMEERGFDTEYVAHDVETLKEKGELYEPNDDESYRTI